MALYYAYRFRVFYLTLFILAAASSGFSGVSRVIQEQYKKDYENKAMYLKIPIYFEKQIIHISGQSFNNSPGSGTPRYKVGDPLRVLQVDFTSDEIKFKLGGITTAGAVELGFKFDSSLQESFPNREVFDRALQAALTEGLKYTEIDDAKRSFIAGQFDRSMREIADSASMNRESVLKNIASRVPAYQDAQHDIETLKNKVQDISGQLSQAQLDNRKHESELKTLQAELSRQKSSNAALQDKIDGYTSQLSKLGDELRDAKGNAQSSQKELANIQRSLNLKADAARDLSQQIADLVQAMQKSQKENESLLQRVGSLQTALEAQKAANARLVGDNEELRAGNRKMQATLDTITSKGDSLAKQFLQLKNEKEKLDDFTQSLGLLRTRIVEEQTESGVYSGKANVYLNAILLGSLSWSIPVYLNYDQSKNAEVTFSAESIALVTATAEEKHFLRSFGERLKIRLALSSSSATMTVSPEKEKPREIGERDRFTWKWTIRNQGTQDSRLFLVAHLINKYSNEIPLYRQEHVLLATNAVRQLRNYLQPVSLSIGAIIGFLLFGIVGIFRRRKPPQTPSGLSPDSTQPILIDRKKRL
jgi:predicted nuclease with TOPRIM domain